MRVKKYMGQHFLRCNWVVERMIDAAKLTPQDTVLEVGPGTGVLTEALAKLAGEVIAVERDDRLANNLNKTLAEKKISNVRIIKADILDLLKSDFHSFNKVVANIPYYLTSRLFRLLLDMEAKPDLIVMTVQKEVAERICAIPPRMNLLAVSIQIFGTPEKIATVPPSCFVPPPKVDSTITRIAEISDKKLRKNSLEQDLFFQAAKIVFSGRRKTLLNNIRNVSGKEQAEKILLSAKIDPQTRAQDLSLENVISLARNFTPFLRNKDRPENKTSKTTRNLYNK